MDEIRRSIPSHVIPFISLMRERAWTKRKMGMMREQIREEIREEIRVELDQLIYVPPNGLLPRVTAMEDVGKEFEKDGESTLEDAEKDDEKKDSEST